jgi:Ca2+-binding EF-hand superfamily protein
MRLIQSAMLGAVLALAIASTRADDKSSAEKDKTNIANATRSEDLTFADLDRNRDGSISKKEAAADPALAKDFDRFDLNHDGKLNRAEYLAARGKEDTRSMAKKVTGKNKAKEPDGK